MLKGVNRQVVEITQPESAYFERVLFFVKPEYSGASESKIRSRADMLIKNVSAPPLKREAFPKHERLKQAVKLILAAVSGAAATGILIALF